MKPENQKYIKTRGIEEIDSKMLPMKQRALDIKIQEARRLSLAYPSQHILVVQSTAHDLPARLGPVNRNSFITDVPRRTHGRARYVIYVLPVGSV